MIALELNRLDRQILAQLVGPGPNRWATPQELADSCRCTYAAARAALARLDQAQLAIPRRAELAEPDEWTATGLGEASNRERAAA